MQAAASGGVSVIDVVPIESSDSSDSSQITVAVADPLGSPNGTHAQNGQQVTAQVAVVQAQDSPNGGQHFITVSGEIKNKF